MGKREAVSNPCRDKLRLWGLYEGDEDPDEDPTEFVRDTLSVGVRLKIKRHMALLVSGQTGPVLQGCRQRLEDDGFRVQLVAQQA